MKKIFEYNYLVLLRIYDDWYGKDMLSYYPPLVMALLLTANICSLFMPFINTDLPEMYLILVNILFISIYSTLSIIYNKKQRDQLRAKYANEGIIAQYKGRIRFNLYVLCSSILFVVSFYIAVNYTIDLNLLFN